MAAGRDESDPDRRILKMLSALGSDVEQSEREPNDYNSLNRAGEGIRTPCGPTDATKGIAALQWFSGVKGPRDPVMVGLILPFHLGPGTNVPRRSEVIVVGSTVHHLVFSTRWPPI